MSSFRGEAGAAGGRGGTAACAEPCGGGGVERRARRRHVWPRRVSIRDGLEEAHARPERQAELQVAVLDDIEERVVTFIIEKAWRKWEMHCSRIR